MAIALSDNLRIGTGKPVDDRYLAADLTPYATVAAANAAIVGPRRHLGLKVLVGSVEHSYQTGIADSNLVPVLPAPPPPPEVVVISTSAPTNQDAIWFNPTDGRFSVWDGAAWVGNAPTGESAGVVTSLTAPSVTSIWFDPSDGSLSVWNGSVWVANLYLVLTAAGFPAGAYINGAGDAYVNGAGAYYLSI